MKKISDKRKKEIDEMRSIVKNRLYVAVRRMYVRTYGEIEDGEEYNLSKTADFHYQISYNVPVYDIYSGETYLEKRILDTITAKLKCGEPVITLYDEDDNETDVDSITLDDMENIASVLYYL